MTLSKGNMRKIASLHRLVAEAFIPNPCNYPVINHIDENKGNNRADNLEWCSAKYNCNYGSRNAKISSIVRSKTRKCQKLTKEDVVAIKEATKNGYTNTVGRELSEKYGVKEKTIRHIAHNRKWKWVKIEKEENNDP